MLLAIDTATHTASIALYDGQMVLGETTWLSRENHTRSLMQELVALLGLVGAKIQEIRAVGVATGPGSFTGLRIGLSAAKGLAYSRNIALVGIPTLDIAAAAAAGDVVCAVIKAGRGRYGAAVYQVAHGIPQRTSDYLFGTAQALAEQLRGAVPRGTRAQLVGELDTELIKAAAAALADQVGVDSDAGRIRRAGYLAVLAWRRWQAGDTDDLQALAPYYIPTATVP